MSYLFSKTQNHLRGEPDRHGAGGTSHSDLRSLGRPHSHHHLEDLYPEHQQRRKGMTSPRVQGHGVQAQSRSCLPRPRSLRGARRWDAGPRGHARFHGLHPPASWPCRGRATGSCIDLPGCEVCGRGQVRHSGEETGSAFQTQDYRALRSREKPRAWGSSSHPLKSPDGNVSWK